MADLRSPDGTNYSTTAVKDKYDLVFCIECGSRICWYDTSFGDEPNCVCEDCIAQETNEQSDDEEE